MSIEAIRWVLYGGEDGGCIPIPTGIAHSVGAQAIRSVLIVLAECADRDSGAAYPSLDTIARASGVDRRSVQSALGALVELGYITRVADAVPRVRGTTYRLALPAADSSGISRRVGRAEHSAGTRRGLGGDSAGTPPGYPGANPRTPDPQIPSTPSSEPTSSEAAKEGEEGDDAFARSLIEEANRRRSEAGLPRWDITRRSVGAVAAVIDSAGYPAWRVSAVLALGGWKTAGITEAALRFRLTQEHDSLTCPACGGWNLACQTCRPGAAPEPPPTTALEVDLFRRVDDAINDLPTLLPWEKQQSTDHRDRGTPPP